MLELMILAGFVLWGVVAFVDTGAGHRSAGRLGTYLVPPLLPTALARLLPRPPAGFGVTIAVPAVAGSADVKHRAPNGSNTCFW